MRVIPIATTTTARCTSLQGEARSQRGLRVQPEGSAAVAAQGFKDLLRRNITIGIERDRCYMHISHIRLDATTILILL